MSWNKTDRSFKILSNRRVTDAEPTKYWYNEKADFTLDLHSLEVKLDTIPNTPPGADTSVVDVYNYAGRLTLIEDTSVPGKMTWFASSNSNTVTAQTDEASRLKDWISDKYGSGYLISLYDSSDVQIPYSDSSGWYFDYPTGILSFSNANTDSGSVASRAPYKIVGYRYIGRKGAGSVTSVGGTNGVKTDLALNAPITASGNLQLDLAYSPTWTGTHVFNGLIGVGTTRTGAISGTNPTVRIKGTGTSSATSSFEIQNSSAGVLFFIRDDGKVAVGTNTPTADLSFGGDAARAISVERKTTGAGSNLTIQAGGAQSGVADTAGGNLILSSGITTGSGSSLIDMRVVGSAGLGSSDQTPSTALYLKGTGISLWTTTQTYTLTFGVPFGNDIPYDFSIGPISSNTGGANNLIITAGNMTADIDIAGGTLELKAGNSTGTGTSVINFYTATASVTGSSVNTSAIRVSISGSGKTSFSPVSTNAALNFGNSGTVGSPSTGDLWWDSGAVALNFRTTTSTINLIPTIGSSIISGGTTGSVLFIGASGFLQQDNNNFFWDNSNKTLGIGTTRTGAISSTNPVLRVKGSGATSSTSVFEVQNSSATVLFFIRDDGLVNLGTKGTYTESTGQLALSTSGSGAGILLGGDVNLYRTAADVLKTDDSLTVVGNLTINSLTSSRIPYASTSGLLVDSPNMIFDGNRLSLATTGNTGGLLIGGDVNLYRDSADVLKTDDSLIVAVNATISTLTAGSIIFSGTSGLISQDNSNFFWDNSNKTLGVGTTRTGAISGTNPSFRVKGTGASSSTSSFEVQSSSATVLLFVRDDGLINLGTKGTYTESTGQLALSASGSSAGILLGGDANLYRDAADVLRTTDSVRIDTSVGINQAAPATTAGRLGVTGSFTALSGSNNNILSTITHTVNSPDTSSGRIWGLRFAVTAAGSGIFSDVNGPSGVEGLVDYTGSGSAAGAIGVTAYCRNSGTGTLTRSVGLSVPAAATNTGGGHISQLRAVDITWATDFSAINQVRCAIRIGVGPTNAGSFGGTIVGGIYFNSSSRGAQDGIIWGTGGDTNLYSSASDTLKTDDSFVVGTNLTVSTLTSGSVPFAGTSGLISQDNSNFYWDNTNKTLGVGTTRTGAISGTNPSVRIKGTGTSSATSSFEIQNSSSASIFFVRNDGLVTVTGTLVATKSITAGVVTLVDGATPALDASLGNIFVLTAAGDRTIAVPTNPTSGQQITIVHKASGANRTLSLNTGAGGFRFGTTITALTTTTSALTDYIDAIYNAVDSRWDVVNYTKGF